MAPINCGTITVQACIVDNLDNAVLRMTVIKDGKQVAELTSVHSRDLPQKIRRIQDFGVGGKTDYAVVDHPVLQKDDRHYVPMDGDIRQKLIYLLGKDPTPPYNH